MENQQRLRDLAQRAGRSVDIFSARHPIEFEQRAAAVSAPRPPASAVGPTRESRSTR